MSTKKLGQKSLNDWVASLIQGHRVYGPQAKADRFAYDLLVSPADLRLDHDVTILPPKKYLLPPREPLVTFTRTGEFQPAMATEPLVLFGVHPYDVAAIGQMDRYFGQDNPDTHYLTRRKNVTIVACDVQTPSENVFAACTGSACVHEGFDVLLTLVGDTYVAESRTPAGDALLAAAGKLEDADAMSLARREQVWLDAEKLLCRHKLRCKPKDLPALLEKSFEHPAWKQKSDTCFSCGSCVMVCPTCFCFDVQDEVNWDLCSGTRCRQWDGCLLSEFAMVAGGHNFRRQREQRYRHRFYRKGKYLPERCGFMGCIGCGRCVGACVAKIASPVELYNSLLED
jgi:sulfhydrogenase subunit beta (sulfur reductase)